MNEHTGTRTEKCVVGPVAEKVHICKHVCSYIIGTLFPTILRVVLKIPYHYWGAM